MLCRIGVVVVERVRSMVGLPCQAKKIKKLGCIWEIPIALLASAWLVEICQKFSPGGKWHEKVTASLDQAWLDLSSKSSSPDLWAALAGIQGVGPPPDFHLACIGIAMMHPHL